MMLVNEKRVVRRMRSLLPPLNFLTLHYLYFIIMGLLWSLIFWASSEPAKTITYTDSLFLSLSAMTGAGLNTVRPECSRIHFIIIIWADICRSTFPP
jgi:hypothetical protein